MIYMVVPLLIKKIYCFWKKNYQILFVDEKMLVLGKMLQRKMFCDVDECDHVLLSILDHLNSQNEFSAVQYHPKEFSGRQTRR